MIRYHDMFSFLLHFLHLLSIDIPTIEKKTILRYMRSEFIIGSGGTFALLSKKKGKTISKNSSRHQ